jgi:outer membrane lipoprotein-sorting protein
MRWIPFKRDLGLVLALLLLSSAAGAAEFSAQMLVKDGDKVMPGKLYVENGLLRQEFTDERGQTITVVRPDKKVVWVILPKERTYMELPLKRRLPGQFIQMPPDAVQKRPLGKETINGYETEKYQVSVKSGEGVEFQNIWVAPKLGMPVKLVVERRHFSVEYRDIREGKQAARRFELPAGYQKLASPAGFADKLEN